MLSLVLAAVFNTSPILALFQVPAWFIGQLPMILQLVLYLFIAVAQFALIFWFLSRGGVDVYFPDDVEDPLRRRVGPGPRRRARHARTSSSSRTPRPSRSKGGYVPGGILLWGPPGTGKTLLAEAVAGETGKPYVFVDPGAFINMFFGVGVLKVKRLYRKLRKLVAALRRRHRLLRRGRHPRAAAAARSSQARRAEMTASARRRTPARPRRATARSYLSAPSQRFIAAEASGASARAAVAHRTNGGWAAWAAADGHAAGAAHRDVRSEEAARLRQPRRTPHPRHAAEAAAEVPHPAHDGDEHARRARPGDAAPGPHRPHLPRRLPVQGRAHRDLRKLPRQDPARGHAEAQIENLATISPYATGATIKDTVNEALIIAIRDGRDIGDLPRPHPGQVAQGQRPRRTTSTYVERERHSIAVHEACHAVAAVPAAHAPRRDRHGDHRDGAARSAASSSSIPLEDRFVEWRSEVEVDVMTFLASLAGERMFYDGDHTQGVGGDMRSATALVTQSFLSHAMGPQLRSFSGVINVTEGVPFEGETAKAIEAKLQELYDRTVDVLEANRREVLAVTHALETHKTLSGEDVVAVIEGTEGPVIDGRGYLEPDFVADLEGYHRRAVEAHKVVHERPPALPSLPEPLAASRRDASTD